MAARAVRRRSAWPLMAIFVAAGLILIFEYIADEVSEGEWQAFERPGERE